jgi:zinc protease
MMNKTVAHALPNPDTISRTVLSNGIVVLVYSNPATQSVVMSGNLPAGSIYEGPAQNGLAAMTAGALMRGTRSRNFQALHSALEDIGADFGIGAGVHGVGFGGKALAEDFSTLVEIMAESLRYPVFPVDQVERLRGEAMTGLKYQLQDTRRQSARAFRETLYASDHPYHYSTRGTLESLPTLTIAQLQDFHARHYGPRGMIISVAGNVVPAEVVSQIESAVGDWVNPEQPEIVRPAAAPQPEEIRRSFVALPGKTQSDVILGVVGPQRKAEDYQAARLANSILGEFGMMGRVGDVVREQSGLAYYAYSRLEGGHGPGAWLVSAGVNPANVERAIELSVSEAYRIADELVSEEELDDNKSYFVGRMPLQLETNEGLAGTVLAMEEFDLGLDYLVRLPEIIGTLTREDLQNAVRHYWRPDAYVVAVAGPKA